MQVPAKTFIIQFIAAAFVFLFTYTALSKLVNYSLFEATLNRSPVIKDFSSIVAWVIPAIELVISILLFFPITRMKGLYASLGLMFSFTIYIGYMLLFASNLPCSCGGVIQMMTWQQHLGFNVAFIFLAGLAITLQKLKLKFGSANSADPV